MLKKNKRTMINGKKKQTRHHSLVMSNNTSNQKRKIRIKNVSWEESHGE